MDKTVPAIALNRISATYVERNQRLPVLADFSMSIAPREFVAIIGPSGSGKSTLLDVIAGLIEPDSGTIALSGMQTNAKQRLGQCGYLRQRDLLMPWRTIVSNTAVGLEAQGATRKQAHSRSLAALRSIGLEQSADSWPSQLSGGMRQRVAVLRTMLVEAPFLLLDEPFASLDAITRSSMHTWLQDILAASNRTTILVTHDVEESLLLADRILVVGPRPATVIAEKHVPFDHPRRPELAATPAFVEARSQLIAMLNPPVAQ